MPFFHTTPLDFHEGERKVQSLLHAPDQDNPTSIGLSPHATRLLHVSSLLAVGTLDKEGQPWTTLLGGEPGFARSLGQSIISVKSKVARQHDPVVNLLVDSEQDGEVHGGGKDGRVISALGIHLATRDRIKLSGRLVAGALGRSGSGAEEDYGAAEIQLILAIHQSLGMQ